MITMNKVGGQGRRSHFDPIKTTHKISKLTTQHATIPDSKVNHRNARRRDYLEATKRTIHMTSHRKNSQRHNAKKHFLEDQMNTCQHRRSKEVKIMSSSSHCSSINSQMMRIIHVSKRDARILASH